MSVNILCGRRIVLLSWNFFLKWSHFEITFPEGDNFMDCRHLLFYDKLGNLKWWKNRMFVWCRVQICGFYELLKRISPFKKCEKMECHRSASKCPQFLCFKIKLFIDFPLLLQCANFQTESIIMKRSYMPKKDKRERERENEGNLGQFTE